MLKKVLLTVLLVLSLLFLCMMKIDAASYDFYILKAKCPVRTSASENASVIKNGNDNVYVYKDMELNYIRTEKGPNNGMQNQDWYAVKFG